MPTLDDLLAQHKPSAERPLLGQTILLVEDSRFACEALRLMCLRSGARLRRAGSLQHARRHLATYRPSVVIVDLGLPDGDGTELISELARATPRMTAILAISGDDTADLRAMAAGADGFMGKPFGGLAAFQSKLLSLLPSTRVPSGPRALPADGPAPDPIAFCDDLRHAAEILSDESIDRVGYAAQFASALARCAGDDDLLEASNRLADEGAGKGARQKLRQVIADRIAGLGANKLTPQAAVP